MTRLRLLPSAATSETALAALVAEHGGAVYGYVFRRTGQRERTQDLVQEIFLRAWRKADTFDPGRGEMRGWLFGIARNVVIDAARADAARPSTVSDEAMLASLVAPEDVEGALDQWLMADALDRLSSVHRQVLVQLYYRRLSVAEAAAESGVPPGTVKSRSTYALRSLRLVLEEMEVSR